MKLLPNESFEIETTTDLAELIGLLRAETRPAPLGIGDPPILPLTLNDTLFIGNVTNEGFELRRNTKYLNWSPPHLFGAFRRSDVGTVINVNVCLTRAKRVSLGLIGLVTALAFLGAFIDDEIGVIVFLFPTAFLGLLYAASWYSVRGEAGESRKTLEAICRSPQHALQ